MYAEKQHSAGIVEIITSATVVIMELILLKGLKVIVGREEYIGQDILNGLKNIEIRGLRFEYVIKKSMNSIGCEMEMTILELVVLIISAINVIMPIVSMIRDREILSHFSAFAGWTSALLYEIAYLCK